jgi:hypothetical protein
VPDYRHVRVGDPRIPALGIDLDIRTDIPRYRVWRNGQLIEEPTDIMAHWRDDLVAFVIGCSFSFEEALIADGLSIRHIDEKRNVPMYRTSIACKSAGPFEGRMVVSMRPFKPAEAIRAIQITTRFPSVHGAPVHIGKPELIGIEDIAKPDYGDAVSIQHDELPVFWACGVTPQSGHPAVAAGFRDHSRAGLHAGDRCSQFGIFNSVIPEQAQASRGSVQSGSISMNRREVLLSGVAMSLAGTSERRQLRRPARNPDRLHLAADRAYGADWSGRATRWKLRQISSTALTTSICRPQKRRTCWPRRRQDQAGVRGSSGRSAERAARKPNA